MMPELYFQFEALKRAAALSSMRSSRRAPCVPGRLRGGGAQRAGSRRLTSSSDAFSAEREATAPCRARSERADDDGAEKSRSETQFITVAAPSRCVPVAEQI